MPRDTDTTLSVVRDRDYANINDNDPETPALDEVSASPRIRRRRRRRWRHLRRLFARRTVVALLALLLFTSLFASIKLYVAYDTYQDVRVSAQELRTSTDTSLMDLSSTELQQILLLSDVLRADLQRMERATSLPFGEGLIMKLPWVGPRYEAGRDTIALAELLADTATRAALVGRDTMLAYETTGVSGAEPDTETWLDVLMRHQPEINAILVEIQRAAELRSEINEALLPGRVRLRLTEIDGLLAKFDDEQLLDDVLALSGPALGAERPMRYLVLFPNPAEMRPAGGFPGTIALVEVERGQLRRYEFFNVAELTRDYIAQRSHKVPLPWPYEQYFFQDGFLLHDIVWRADFARLGDELMAMYAETDWPPIDGVVALQQTLPADLLRNTGGVQVEVDGELRTVTADNLHEEIERQRRRRLEGEQVETHHKEVVAEVGSAIIERLKTGDREQLRQVITTIQVAAERRDAQFYAADPVVQAWLDERRWSGRLLPDPETPTLAVIFGSLIGHKGDQRMHPEIEMTVEPATAGRQEVLLEIHLAHTGTDEELQFYSGFQRWWVEVTLPEGARRLWTHDTPQPDPESPNGGSYLIEIFPQQTGYVALRFEITAGQPLLVRRQPGVTPVQLELTVEGCPDTLTTIMNAGDIVLDIGPDCAG